MLLHKSRFKEIIREIIENRIFYKSSDYLNRLLIYKYSDYQKVNTLLINSYCQFLVITQPCIIINSQRISAG